MPAQCTTSVDPAKLLDRRPEELTDLAHVGDVGPHRQGLPTGSSQLGDGLVRGGGIPRIVEDDRKPVAREPPGHGSSDSARGAGDDRRSCGRVHGRPPFVATYTSNMGRHAAE